MADLRRVVRELESRRQDIQGQLSRIDAAIGAIKGTGRKRTGRRKGTTMSASAKAKIAKAQKKRWAKWRRRHGT